MPKNQHHPTPAERDERVKLDLPPDEFIAGVMGAGTRPEDEAQPRFVRITCQTAMPNEFQVYFDDASADSRPGGLDMARALAEASGFEVEPWPDTSTLAWKLPGSDWTAVLDTQPIPGVEGR